jgi:GTP-binding protein
MFVDSAKVRVKAGKGGRGCVSFRREKFIDHGGPDGGNGGDGGSILFVGDKNKSSLIDFRYTPEIKAKNGSPGQGSLKTGRKGKDIVLRVPPGTVVSVIEKDNSENLLCDITKDKEKYLVAEGGKGGRGNASFKSSTNQAPRRYEEGGEGEEFLLKLELKLIADVGLVGLPNAGKSSFISKVSHARPKVASYPFTTLSPVLGEVVLPGYRTLVVADIPGIIEGAHDNKGLGHEFLKHIERTRVLIYVIDFSEYADEHPKMALTTIKKELFLFSETLSKKPFIIAANKIDLYGNDLAFDELLDKFDFPYTGKDEVVPISAVTGKGINNLLEKVWKMLKNFVDE